MVGRWRVGRWLDAWLLNGLAILALQFGDPQVEPFNFLVGDQIDFTTLFLKDRQLP